MRDDGGRFRRWLVGGDRETIGRVDRDVDTIGRSSEAVGRDGGRTADGTKGLVVHRETCRAPPNGHADGNSSRATDRHTIHRPEAHRQGAVRRGEVEAGTGDAAVDLEGTQRYAR